MVAEGENNMADVGYSEGYLEALSKMSGVQAQRDSHQQRLQQMQGQQRQAQENQQEKGVLAGVFKQRADQSASMSMADQSDRLAQQYQQAGKKLMGINPADAMKMLQEGDRLTERNAHGRLEMAKAEKLKGEYLASMASTVQDQDGLNEFVQKSAKEGQVVPRKYQEWNQATASYLERAVKGSMPISKQQDLALKARELELKGVAEERKQQDEDRKMRLDSVRETRLREGLDIKKRAAGDKATSELGLRGEKAVEGEINILRDTDTAGAFKSAAPGIQRAAAQDVHYRAQKIRSDSLMGGEEPVSAEEALGLAREQVIGEFKKQKGEGFLGTGFGGKDTATRQKGGVDQKAAQAPMSVKSDADYAKVPSGAEYISPDGKRRRKS
jgi:hypothetical protein